MDEPTENPQGPMNDASELGQPGAVNETRPSRKALWLAMSSVALAIALVWMAPGLDDHDHLAGGGVGSEAPLDVTLKDMNGIDVRLDSFEGKIVLVNFWATWCLPCKAEIPDLVAMQAKYKDDVVVLGISVDDTAEQIKPYAVQYKVNYRMLVDNKQAPVQESLGPLGVVPVTIVIDRDGVITRKHAGIMTREQMEAEITPLL